MSICWVIEPCPLPKPCIKIPGYAYFTIVLISVIFFSASLSRAGDKILPFSIEEEIIYTVRWEMIRAGKARFKVLPLTSLNGENAYHFKLEVKSTRYVDMLYKIRDCLEGFADHKLTRSLLYKKRQSGKDKKDITVHFDWENNTAVYANFGSKRDPVGISLNTFDPLSAFYNMRTLDFKIDQTLSFPVTDGKKVFTQKGRVIKKEKLTLRSGTYDTYQLDLMVNHFSGVFKKSENPTVKVWVSADDRKIPVRIKVKVFIGSVIFDLVSVK